MTGADKIALDGVSIVTVLGTLSGILPAIAAVFTIVWTSFRIYETKTVQRWLYGEPKTKIKEED
ncbi:MAG: hypothetical protein JW395_1584 [Nitrospira sp.]|nr:hypothetical protein [Nitrospira sp.]